VLFRASEKALRGLDDAQGGWQQYALGGVEIHEVEADHGNILNEPQVRQLADRIRARLEKARAEVLEDSVSVHSVSSR
jgi:thioesterase domain-containing protein